MNILVTGGAGYIGSHCVRLLHEKSEMVVVLDNLSKGHKEALQGVVFIQGDIEDKELVAKVCREHEIEAVIHFAAFSNVGESVEKPELYHRENVEKMKSLLDTVIGCGVKYWIFSSSAAIFGEPQYLPIDEEHPKNPVNPYGETKLKGETLLAEAQKNTGLKYCALRYFNAAGASHDSLIGESHNPESHLLPLVFKTALGEREKLFVFGNDYGTKDGTCIRDYIHVEDLAEAHYKALKYLAEGGESQAFNLGSAVGYSILDIIQKFEEISGLKLNYEIADRRKGDPAVLIASSEKAKAVLDWSADRSELEKIMTDAWNWEKVKRY